MLSTMQDGPLLISGILRHGQQVYGDSRVVTITGPAAESTEATYAEVARRAEQLAAALGRLGIGDSRPGRDLPVEQPDPPRGLPGRAVHGRGAAHPQPPALPRAAGLRDQPRRGPGHHLRRLHRRPPGPGPRPDPDGPPHRGGGGGRHLGARRRPCDYEELLAAEEPGYDWPRLDERQAAAMCYTSGTTGNPKGVVYSHRSTFLHTMAITAGGSLGISERDSVLSIVPMFHANAWGTPYAGVHDRGRPDHAPAVPPGRPAGRHHRAVPAHRLGRGARPSGATCCATPRPTPSTCPVLRMITAGGAAVPRQLIERFRDELGVEMVQGWGMTETSPLCSLATPPRQAGPDEEIEWRAKTGRIVPGVEVRVCADDGTVLPNDGESVGEFEVRGPWITGSYYGDPSPDRFHDGWLRTGDIGSLDGRGYMQISDRTKDVIKSGGEWISSVELENEVMAHPDVVEAAVIAVPDDRWSERPLVAVVLEEGSTPRRTTSSSSSPPGSPGGGCPSAGPSSRRCPRRVWASSTRRSLRARHAEGDLEVIEVDIASGG